MQGLPTPPPVQPKNQPSPTTVEVRDGGKVATTEFIQTSTDPEGEARQRLTNAGLNPDEWVVTGFRSSKGTWGNSARYTFARKSEVAAAYGIEEVLEWIDLHDYAAPPERPARTGLAYGWGCHIADNQYGKYENLDAPERALALIDEAVLDYQETALRENVTEVVVSFLGDHVEGFMSQGGANTWRTQLTLTDQIRLTRRMMAYALTKFAAVVPMDVELIFVAVPGNHGDAFRPLGGGRTTYNDNFDTDALVAVSEGAAMSSAPEIERVKFYVPELDEVSVVLDMAETRLAFVHGDQWKKPELALEWLKGQAFSKQSPLRDVDVLHHGHWHQFIVKTESGVASIGSPALETESTYIRHLKGYSGDPGLLTTLFRAGRVESLRWIRP